VIIIVLLSLSSGVIPRVVLSIIAAVCLDYFFALPHFSLQIDAPQDAVEVAAFATTAFVITGLVRPAHRLAEAAVLKDGFKSSSTRFPLWSGAIRPTARPIF
jgi:K+-sensing histidine kinase KdpD